MPVPENIYKKRSPFPATSTKNKLRSYFNEPKYITNLVVKGQGGSKNPYTRAESRDLLRAARVHYFATPPANKLVEMKLDVKQRAAFAERVFNPKKMIDNDAPRLEPRIPRTERAAFRLDDIMLENKQLLERICLIWRTKGMVDTSAPTVEWKSNYRARMWDMVQREADNVALLYFIQTAAALVPTRDECARDFKKEVDKMKYICKFPLVFIKDTNVDLPLPMPNPPPVEPDAPLRKRVFMEFITSQERFLGRIEMELFEDQAPQTVANFLAHIRSEAPRPQDADVDAEDGDEDGARTFSYRDSPLHRILPGYYCLGGDVVNKNGSAGNSIHGGAPFPDEKNDLTHCEPGLLCTIGAKADSNDSKFMITMKALPTLDGTSTVFGRVVKGFEVLWAINSLGFKVSGKPTVQVYCCNCGELSRTPRDGKKKKRMKAARTKKSPRKQLADKKEEAASPAPAPQRSPRPRQHWNHSRRLGSSRMIVAGDDGASQHRSPYSSSRNFGSFGREPYHQENRRTRLRY